MYTIYNSLTGSNESYGINFLKVFCDSVMIGVRCFDPDHDTYHGHILFEKLNYNYTDGVMSESKAAMLNMGELAADPTSYASNGFVDVFFNTSKKEVMLFTLSSLENSFVPYIYNYNINEHILKKIYPILSEDVDNWQTSNFGALVTNQPPLLSITDNKADLVVATTKNNNRSTVISRCNKLYHTKHIKSYY